MVAVVIKLSASKMTDSIAKITVILSLLACIQVGLTISIFEESKIVNGEKAAPGEIPYQISLQKNGQHKCGGSVLNKDYVLTAAHCVSNFPPQNLSIIAGTVNLDDLKEASTHKVTKVTVHEQYNLTDYWRNDIALLKVEPSFKFSVNISAVPLPSSGLILKDKEPAIVSGFGFTSLDSQFTSKNLLKTDVVIRSNKKCLAKYVEGVYATNICSVNSKRSTGFCLGDSGGPLTVGGTIVGIVSNSYKGCQIKKLPQVYTRVSEYIDWIALNSK